MGYFWDRLDPALKEYEKSFADAEEAVENAKRLPDAATLAGQLKSSFREVEIRDHLEKAGVNAVKLVLDAAKAGRLEVLQTVTESAFPCLSEDVMNGAYEIYLNDYHKELLTAKNQAQFFREALRMKVFAINRGIDQLSKSNFK